MPPSCHSAEGNGGEENGESIARRADAGAFGSAGAGFMSSRYAAASRLKKFDEQSLLDPAATVDAAGSAVPSSSTARAMGIWTSASTIAAPASRLRVRIAAAWERRLIAAKPSLEMQSDAGVSAEVVVVVLAAGGLLCNLGNDHESPRRFGSECSGAVRRWPRNRCPLRLRTTGRTFVANEYA